MATLGETQSNPTKKDPFHQDSRARDSYSALLDLHSWTVEQMIVMNSILKFATEAQGGWGTEKQVP